MWGQTVLGQKERSFNQRKIPHVAFLHSGRPCTRTYLRRHYIIPWRVVSDVSSDQTVTLIIIYTKRVLNGILQYACTYMAI